MASDRSWRMRRLPRRGRPPFGFAAGTMLYANARTQRVLALALANDQIQNVQNPKDGPPESTRAKPAQLDFGSRHGRGKSAAPDIIVPQIKTTRTCPAVSFKFYP